jgi:CheY-like chemotaxis protein
LGDANRVRQVLLNLVGNAVKFTDQGRVTIDVDTVQCDDGKWLTLTVTDTGIGIPAHAQKRLFARFSQADSSMARRYGGSGLGLAISKIIVERMGGKIGFASMEGEGSRFWFELPFRRGKLDITVDAETPALPSRLLICCREADERAEILHLARRLRIEGIQVESPVDALQVLREAVSDGQPVDVLLMEDAAEGLSPNDMAAILASDQALANIRLIAIHSGNSPPASLPGAVGELVRPVTASALDFALTNKSTTAPKSPPRQMHLLLIEDNAINQQVAIGFLAKLGHLVDVAGDGVEGIGMLEQKSYDLVLMDIQMPGMDGFEATRKIRRLGGRLAQLPVVAMTANAMAGDRERCLAAGMNDYISKPLNRRSLELLLEKWTDLSEEPSRS